MSMDFFDPEREPDELFDADTDIDTDADEPDADPESRDAAPDEESVPTPRTIDAATWAARGIVVLTLGLVAVVGGLLLGTSVTDSTQSEATPTVTSSTTVADPIQTQTEPVVARVTAPAVRISAAAPDAPVATRAARATTATPTRATSTQAPTVAASPTSTVFTRGKSTNTGKPKPTKP